MKMAKTLRILLLLPSLLANPHAQGQLPGLPRWFDPLLEKSDGLPPAFHAPFADSFSAGEFRVPAEFEPVQSVILGWKDPTSFVNDISQALAEETQVNVIVASGPRRLSRLPDSRYVPVDCQINSIWMRDYGPIGIHLGTREIGFVDAVYRHFASRRNDDALPSCLAERLGRTSVSADLILDGGNFMVDSAGQLFMTRRTYEWNPQFTPAQIDDKLKRIYGAVQVHSLDYAGDADRPIDGTGHIDMFAKLLSSDTVMISEAQSEPFRSTFERSVDYFKSIKTVDGRAYRILRVPGWYKNDTWYTYTNSLLVNGLALVPSYSGEPEKNAEARAAYESAGFKVRMISSDKTIVRGGSIHCVTQTVPSL